MEIHMSLLKVKPWGEGQGDHVLINEEDFNEVFHSLLDAEDKPKAPAKADKAKPEAKSAD
jgi:hypothetical protein